jgi:hypothetical protein
MYPLSRTQVLVLTVMMLSLPTYGQDHERLQSAGGPFSSFVPNAPFSATAVTRVKERLPNGAVQEHTVTATVSRDSQGRVRAELDSPWGPYVVLWIREPESERWTFYRLEPANRTYRIMASFAAHHLFNGEGRVAIPLGRACFRLAPPVEGFSGADRLTAVNPDVASDLGIVVTSHRSDDIGTVDYELTNIRRGEPSSQLFQVPSNYTLVRGSHEDPLVAFAPWNLAVSCAEAQKP